MVGKSLLQLQPGVVDEGILSHRAQRRVRIFGKAVIKKADVADKPFVMPKTFLRRAEEMGELLNNCPVPDEFLN